MSLFSQLQSTMAHFSGADIAGDILIWDGAEYTGVAGAESIGEDYETEGNRLWRRLVFELPIAQFGGAIPPTRARVLYDSREYVIQQIEADSASLRLTLKAPCGG